MKITLYHLAQRFVGVKEVPGKQHNPLIMSMLHLDAAWPEGDEVAWCSAFLNFVCWLLRLPRSKSLRARSWLGVGTPVMLEDARVGWDIVILKRGPGEQPGPEVIDAPGHVGLYAGHHTTRVLLLGGNQSDNVQVSEYARDRVLGVRRLYEEAT
jgi:uncharacterized protein (TIGR02594 family)